MTYRISDDQLDRSIIRVLEERADEIELSGITPAAAAARVRTMRSADVRRSLVWVGLLALLAVVLAVAAAALVGARPSPLPRTYDDVFVPTGSLGEARSRHTATLLQDGRVLIVGGRNAVAPSPDEERPATASAEIWDPTFGTFSPVGSLATARSGHMATLLPDGSVLIVGGDGAEAVDGTAELWDPTSETFHAAGALVAGLPQVLTATLLPDGRVLVLSLDETDGNAQVIDAELWDPGTESFSPIAWPGTYGTDTTATLLPDGKVLVVSRDAQLWDPATQNLRPAGSIPLSAAFQRRTATLLPDGSVLIVGGRGQVPDLRGAGLWDRTTESFHRVGSLAGGYRENDTATLLQDGRVLVIGGGYFEHGNPPYPTNFLWDRSSPTFGPAASSLQARLEHTATLLPDGRVLVVGGRGADGSRLATAELYQ